MAFRSLHDVPVLRARSKPGMPRRRIPARIPLRPYAALHEDRRSRQACVPRRSGVCFPNGGVAPAGREAGSASAGTRLSKRCAGLFDFPPVSSYARFQERFRKIALTAESESPKALIPFSMRHIRIGRQPTVQFVEIGDRSPALPKVQRQVVHDTVCPASNPDKLRRHGGSRGK